MYFRLGIRVKTLGNHWWNFSLRLHSTYHPFLADSSSRAKINCKARKTQGLSSPYEVLRVGPPVPRRRAGPHCPRLEAMQWSRIPYESQIFLVLHPKTPINSLGKPFNWFFFRASETFKCCFSSVLIPRQLLECGSRSHHIISTWENTWTITPLCAAPRGSVTRRTPLHSLEGRSVRCKDSEH